MSTLATTPAAVPRSRGRGYFWAGLGLCVLGIAGFMAQFALNIPKTPWYSPVLATIGALLLLLSLARRFTIPRVLGLLLVTGFAALQWYFFGVMMKLPDYKGPEPGRPVPAFVATLADGKTLQESDLRDGKRSVLVFFRGRW